jgi:putative oxidoreductase
VNRELASDVGRFLLRFTVGALLLVHGVQKLTHGVDGIARGVVLHGLPHFVAYGVYVGEVIAPVLTIVGVFTRPAALVIVFNMLVAIALQHPRDVAHLSRTGGWAIELPALYLLGAACVALLGAGRFSGAGARGRWN